ncbi:hypothetical protein V6M85_09935 [Sulfolobus tengchongensis]|uniref:Reverse transcriptase RNase H-like domain-containing protein n=1 Tax=Sulfolobus tengchongensis TaxID=207809 RepID=A0AAX4KYK9_9CREN
MISWLLGSEAPSWSYLSDLFQDYRNVAVYTDHNNIIQIVKVSDIDEFYTQFSVLVHAKYFKSYNLYYIKLQRFVTFPTIYEEVANYFINLKGWRGIKYYYNDEFLGAWLLYDCYNCKEKQRAHLEINRSSKIIDELIKAHLRIYNS